ncbi:hypothetical protein DsansV1_C06g0061461 [Dioscorea sansibarensis]
MAQAMRGHSNESQLMEETTSQDVSKMRGEVSHDQLCDSMHERVLNMNAAMKQQQHSSSASTKTMAQATNKPK